MPKTKPIHKKKPTSTKKDLYPTVSEVVDTTVKTPKPANQLSPDASRLFSYPAQQQNDETPSTELGSFNNSFANNNSNIAQPQSATSQELPVDNQPNFVSNIPNQQNAINTNNNDIQKVNKLMTPTHSPDKKPSFFGKIFGISKKPKQSDTDKNDDKFVKANLNTLQKNEDTSFEENYAKTQTDKTLDSIGKSFKDKSIIVDPFLNEHKNLSITRLEIRDKILIITFFTIAIVLLFINLIVLIYFFA
ncbi:hypothetical protein FACS189459_2700 [Bacilli bacterium]|nr:hypothetical protein FACS189459_2700 [Bacilli bacterium]GHU52260.1 hypothetical protein FACS189496_2110 [Bacilli bacterium]